MRQWVVLACIAENQRDEWYDSEVRDSVETKLATIEKGLRGSDEYDFLTQEQKRIGRFWNQLSQLRNKLHHHGMRPEAVEKGSHGHDEILAVWGELEKGTFRDIYFPQNTVQVLVIPASPESSLLRYAIESLQPDTCVAVCREQSRVTNADTSAVLGEYGLS
jgi:hypothetical protein